VVERANLEPQFLAGMLQSLASVGLVSRQTGRWELTAAGREALGNGSFRALSRERRTFYFVDNSAIQRPSHYLILRPVLQLPRPSGEGGDFDADLLRACVRQPSDWKHRHGFPEEVTRVLELRAEEGSGDWRRVVLDLPEQLLALFTLVAGEGGGN